LPLLSSFFKMILIFPVVPTKDNNLLFCGWWGFIRFFYWFLSVDHGIPGQAVASFRRHGWLAAPVVAGHARQRQDAQFSHTCRRGGPHHWDVPEVACLHTSELYICRIIASIFFFVNQLNTQSVFLFPLFIFCHYTSWSFRIFHTSLFHLLNGWKIAWIWCVVKILFGLFTSWTHGRFVYQLKDNIIPPDPITSDEKKTTLSRLNQIIQHRLVTTTLPPQMSDFKVCSKIFPLYWSSVFDQLYECIHLNIFLPCFWTESDYISERNLNIIWPIYIRYVHLFFPHLICQFNWTYLISFISSVEHILSLLSIQLNIFFLGHQFNWTYLTNILYAYTVCMNSFIFSFHLIHRFNGGYLTVFSNNIAPYIRAYRAILWNI
jgi:hypothetical protein